MYRILSTIVCRVLEIFPLVEAARPRTKSGIQALCALHVALDRAKGLLRHCSDCSKLYLAITADSILMKFEKARCSLEESLRRVEDIVPQAIGCQVIEIVGELEGTIFILDQSEKLAGDEVIALLQKDRRCSSIPNDSEELEVFHQAASRLGITSSRAALTERRALKNLIERAHAEEDKRKESILSYLYHLMRKYSKLFRCEVADDTDSQGSAPCSPTVLSFEEVSASDGNGLAFERHLSKLRPFNSRKYGIISGKVPLPPEELRCPISLQLMYDPVIISSGQTYERICIEKWFSDGHGTCPKTQQHLAHLCITPNYCVKGLIASWCEQNGVPLPDGPAEPLDANYWRLAFSECEAMDSRSMGSIDSCKLQGVKVVPLEYSSVTETFQGIDACTLDSSFCQDGEVDELEGYKSLLAVLCESNSMGKKCRAVERIRYLLKNDEEARIFMGANGAVEPLLQFLKFAVNDGDRKAQEVGAMALSNLAVNNNRNKSMLLSGGVFPLLEQMISNSETREAATALCLNVSCLDEAKPLVGSSQVVLFLVQLLQAEDNESSSCKHDALDALCNLSSHPLNVPFLLSSSIVDGLHNLLTACGRPEGLTWVEKALAVFINLATSQAGKKEIISTPGLIGGLTAILDVGEPAEREHAVSCLLILCNGDERCSHMVLQEGVIPSLVSLSVCGTARGKEKAQKLLKLFREQRQREPSPVRQQQLVEHSASNGGVMELKPSCKSRSKKLGRTLSSIWKNKVFSVYQC
ncbi:U-box domain-containing protein 45 isoform X2 [Elaeis guineensis]